MMQLFHTVSELCSRVTTEQYSTSFFSSIRLLHHDLRQPIFNIYGFVRFADEIVDTFHQHDKSTLLAEFKQQTYEAIERKISLNPILHSFQKTVNEYNIDHDLIEAFFRSMEMDLDKKAYDANGYAEYIYGSAEVVGLMCLFVFCEGDRSLYQRLKAPARSLGAAFQKVNFLRDIKADFNQLDRVYFPGCDFNNFTACDKSKIEADIQKDFDDAYTGIMQLPVKARFGVYVAYKYYLSLFKKIKQLQPQRILIERIRIPNYRKAMIVVRAGVKNQLNLI
ncbi:phytoene/squalene synthase family protein [Flavihumibacter rivuli]|uniref:phytoene/squalene synthase family protein n=1 Tax=Flavihumibacter rivuli TaxID=2838156 RepID=UPI001BDEC870|nr:phytoene/squalene synthase family protein [Flavihumibacter rivuli]ULQ56280.1 phytoene/squalene synthase family protein [Flavihumibacter rivuli]